MYMYSQAHRKYAVSSRTRYRFSWNLSVKVPKVMHVGQLTLHARMDRGLKDLSLFQHHSFLIGIRGVLSSNQVVASSQAAQARMDLSSTAHV